MNRAPITPTYHDKRVVTSRASGFAVAMEIALNLRNEKSLYSTRLYPFDANLLGGEWIVIATFLVAQ